MKKIILLVLILTCISCQDTNSNSLDNLNFGQTGPEVPVDTTDPGAVRFQAAVNVLNTRCTNCHTGYHSSWSAYSQNEQGWIDNNLVVVGDTDASSIITRLQVWGSVGTTMPQGEAALTNEEFTYLDDWIRNLE